MRRHRGLGMTATNTPATNKPRRGRPPLGKRGTFTFRVTDQLRGKLEQAAEAAARPVSELIEARLERSFGGIEEGNRKGAKLMEIIEILGRVAQLRTNKTADDDPDTFEVIRLAAVRYLESASAYLT